MNNSVDDSVNLLKRREKKGVGMYRQLSFRLKSRRFHTYTTVYNVQPPKSHSLLKVSDRWPFCLRHKFYFKEPCIQCISNCSVRVSSFFMWSKKSKRFCVENVKIRLTEAPVPNSTHAAYEKIFRQPLIDNRLVDFVCHNTFSYIA